MELLIELFWEVQENKHLAGTQIGGIFKLGGCGCGDTMMGDLAHALQCNRRSLADIQELVLAGTYGSM